MTTIYINHPMFDEMLSHSKPPKVPKRLQAIIDKGFCIVDGCIFLKALYDARPGLATCPSDRTGREGYLNGIEVDMFCNRNYYSNALAYSKLIAEKWREDFPERQGTLAIYIYPTEDCGYHVTLCSLRNDEPQWLEVSDNNFHFIAITV